MPKVPLKRQTPEQGAALDAQEELDAQLKSRQRREAEKRKALRPRQTYDLPIGLIDAVREIAAREGVTQSDVMAWAAAEFVDHYRAGGVDWEEHKRPTQSLKAKWKLLLPGTWGRPSGMAATRETFRERFGVPSTVS